jgi:hypothetical protein
MPGVQYGSTTQFLIGISKKKPPTKAVVKRLIALAGFIKRSAI